MNVLFPFTGDTVGGSHVASAILIRHLRETGVRPVVVLHGEGALGEYLRAQGIEYSVLDEQYVPAGLNILSQISRMLRIVKPLSGFLRGQEIDIVHTNDLRMHYTWLFPALFTPGVRHVWHQHSQSASWRLALFALFAGRVLTVSQYCLRAFPWIIRRRMEVVYNPFEAETLAPGQKEHFRALMRKNLGLENGARIAGFVGNLTHQKRPGFFVALARRIKKDFPGDAPVHFVLVGEKRPDIYAPLARQVQMDALEANVHFLGPRFPVEPEIAAFDVLVAPGKNEGLGRTIVEAMLCETPVIAAEDGGHLEIIEHEKTGFLIAPEDIQCFAQTLMSLLSSPALAQEITQNAKRCAVEIFRAQAYRDRIISIYTQDTQKETWA